MHLHGRFLRNCLFMLFATHLTMCFLPALLVLLPFLTHLQAALAIPLLDRSLNSIIALYASLNNSQINLEIDHKLECYNPKTFGPRQALMPVDYHRCLPLLNDMLAKPGAQRGDRHATTEGDLPSFQNNGCMIDLKWPPNTHVTEVFSLMEMAVAAAVTIKGCIEAGGYARRGGLGWITRFEVFRVEVRSPMPPRPSNAGITNATSSFDPSASGIVTSSTGSALEERSAPDTEATSSFTPPIKTDSLNTSDQASTNTFYCHKSPHPGTHVGEIPPADCYYLFYEQLNTPNVMVRQPMFGTHPRPEVYFGKCHLKFKGTSAHSRESIRAAEVITVAARIVNRCDGDTYEYTLYGGVSSVGRTNGFTCEIWTPIYHSIGG